MIKIPEQTFSGHSSQVQIASQVAWEGLIDALIHPPLLNSETSDKVENIQQLQLHAENGCQVQTSVFTKSIKLIMIPLIDIISSKCDTPILLSCLNTWCYLLHKLDISINHPSLAVYLWVCLYPFIFLHN